jgi:hypothetical protein
MSFILLKNELDKTMSNFKAQHDEKTEKLNESLDFKMNASNENIGRLCLGEKGITLKLKSAYQTTQYMAATTYRFEEAHLSGDELDRFINYIDLVRYERDAYNEYLKNEKNNS